MRRGRSHKSIFLLSLVAIGIVLAVYVSLHDSQQPATTTGRLVGRTARFPIAVEPAVLPLLQQAILNADSAVIDGLIQEGEVFTVANNRQVEIQVAGRAGIEVRVLNGTQAGRSGWVAPQFVQLQPVATPRS